MVEEAVDQLVDGWRRVIKVMRFGGATQFKACTSGGMMKNKKNWKLIEEYLS